MESTSAACGLGWVTRRLAPLIDDDDFEPLTPAEVREV